MCGCAGGPRDFNRENTRRQCLAGVVTWENLSTSKVPGQASENLVGDLEKTEAQAVAIALGERNVIGAGKGVTAY